MKNILKKVSISFVTYLFFLMWFVTGYIKPAFLIFFIVIIHESGHIFTTCLFNYQITRITIYPFGGITGVRKPINSLLIHDFFIAISGVIMQLVLYLLFFIMNRLYLIENNLFNLFCYYNFSILIFNLLPIYPLDGYKIVESIIERFISYYYSQFLMVIISIISLVSFIIYNIYFKINNYIILSFLLVELLKHYKRRKLIYNNFLLERLLHPFKYRKIMYNDDLKLELLMRDTYHYFKEGKFVYSEKELLTKKFDINSSF